MVIPAGKALRRVLAMQEGTSEELGLNIVLSIFKDPFEIPNVAN